MFFILIAVGVGWWINPDLPAYLGLVKNDFKEITRAWNQHESNLIVEFEGSVIRVLPDLEDVGSKFQQFRVELENGHTVQVSHDLNVASAVPVVAGSKVRIKGEYDWSERGGLVHWTHGDPTGTREGGWIEHAGRVYR